MRPCKLPCGKILRQSPTVSLPSATPAYLSPNKLTKPLHKLLARQIPSPSLAVSLTFPKGAYLAPRQLLLAHSSLPWHAITLHAGKSRDKVRRQAYLLPRKLILPDIPLPWRSTSFHRAKSRDGAACELPSRHGRRITVSIRLRRAKRREKAGRAGARPGKEGYLVSAEADGARHRRRQENPGTSPDRFPADRCLGAERTRHFSL